ncbi:helix-turn-helix domain-containing protein [Streptomyces sp. NPDC002506]|uniref:helix-turn-helix domain-containing protein n=1 Tax=Streptomyces sp. NPDC002506 TaxID=3154536 RepID=UPI00331D9B8E
MNTPTTLWVPEAGQWLSTTASRVAADGYSWMQAVHWVAEDGRYRPRRSHGPSFGATTLRVARELISLSPCRPGISHLQRRLGMSERTVQYHLQMLRQAGLLAYVRRGTRVRGEGALASEFARVIPHNFDLALGIRTRGEGVTRRVVGIAESGRARIAALARLAAGGRRTAKARRAGCTPMGVATRGLPGADRSFLPPESKLAGGPATPAPPRRRGRVPSRLNKTGRRHQLAGELIREVDWLGRCQAPRIAWVVRQVADAGWTATEVRAWLHLRGGVSEVRRPSGLLATLLDGAERVLDTPAKRAAAVERWRDSCTAAQERHRQWSAAPSGPRSPAVRQRIAAALGRPGTGSARWPRTGPAVPPTAFAELPAAPTSSDASAHAAGSPLSACERAVLREAARGEFLRGETTLVRSAVEAVGRAAAQEVYGSALVSRALRLAACTSRTAFGG